MKIAVWKKTAIAVAAGIAMALANHAWTLRAQRQWEQSVSMTTLLRAKKYVAQGKTLTADMVEEIPVPLKARTPALLSVKKELVGAAGQPLYKTRLGLLKGEWISRSMVVENESDFTAAWALEPGQNAWSMRLRPEDAVSGLIQPGDLVNVVATTEKKSQAVLSHARVLAVGDKIWDRRGAARSTSDAKPVSFAEDVLVTLTLKENEVARLAAAERQAKITLALVSPLDAQP